MRLQGKVIVVTGATGIAAAGASRFSAEGASVYVVSIDPDECETLAASLADGAWSAADLREETATDEAITAARTRFGRIDGLFAVAGGSGRAAGDGPLHEIPLAGWDATLAANLTTTVLATRSVVRTMLADAAGGSIVFVSSVLATHPAPGHFATHAYAAAKGAQLALTRALAAYYATNGIRVNAISPGLVRTPMAQRALGDPNAVAFVEAKQPLAGGTLDPDDIAAAAVYLLGDESRHVTGQVISVDGGWGVTEV